MTKEHPAKENNYDNKIVEPQLNIILTTDEDDNRPVYISGNFNNWVTQDKKFVMEKIENNLFI